MEGKICARNICAQLLVQSIFGELPGREKGFHALLGIGRKMDTASPAGLF